VGQVAAGGNKTAKMDRFKPLVIRIPELINLIQRVGSPEGQPIGTHTGEAVIVRAHDRRKAVNHLTLLRGAPGGRFSLQCLSHDRRQVRRIWPKPPPDPKPPQTKLPPGANRILFVKNLNYQITGDDLYELFGRYGSIRQVRLGNEPKTKGTAFVVFDDVMDVRCNQPRIRRDLIISLPIHRRRTRWTT
jgi:hypothetical protein